MIIQLNFYGTDGDSVESMGGRDEVNRDLQGQLRHRPTDRESSLTVLGPSFVCFFEECRSQYMPLRETGGILDRLTHLRIIQHDKSRMRRRNCLPEIRCRRGLLTTFALKASSLSLLSASESEGLNSTETNAPSESRHCNSSNNTFPRMPCPNIFSA